MRAARARARAACAPAAGSARRTLRGTHAAQYTRLPHGMNGTLGSLALWCGVNALMLELDCVATSAAFVRRFAHVPWPCPELHLRGLASGDRFRRTFAARIPFLELAA